MALSTIDSSSISGLGYGFKNRIINGDMRIDQRNAGASYTATTGGLRYGVDRWLIYCSGANVTGQQIAGTNTETAKAFRITGATGNNYLNFEQRIESLNTSDLANQVVTFKAKVWCSASISNAFVYAISPTVVDNYGSVTSSINTPITLNSGLNTIVVTGTLNSTANLGQAFGINFGSGISNSVYVDIAEVQVEKGSTATSFDYRPYGTELALCQRYARVMRSSAYTKYASGTVGNSTTVFALTIPLAIPMRSAPSVAFSGTTVLVSGSASFALNTVNNLSSADAVCFDATLASGSFTAGYSALIGSDATATSVMTISAEL